MANTFPLELNSLRLSPFIGLQLMVVLSMSRARSFEESLLQPKHHHRSIIIYADCFSRAYVETQKLSGVTMQINLSCLIHLTPATKLK